MTMKQPDDVDLEWGPRTRQSSTESYRHVPLPPRQPLDSQLPPPRQYSGTQLPAPTYTSYLSNDPYLARFEVVGVESRRGSGAPAMSLPPIFPPSPASQGGSSSRAHLPLPIPVVSSHSPLGGSRTNSQTALPSPFAQASHSGSASQHGPMSYSQEYGRHDTDMSAYSSAQNNQYPVQFNRPILDPRLGQVQVEHQGRRPSYSDLPLPQPVSPGSDAGSPILASPILRDEPRSFVALAEPPVSMPLADASSSTISVYPSLPPAAPPQTQRMRRGLSRLERAPPASFSPSAYVIQSQCLPQPPTVTLLKGPLPAGADLASSDGGKGGGGGRSRKSSHDDDDDDKGSIDMSFKSRSCCHKLWIIYCHLITFFLPQFLLSLWPALGRWLLGSEDKRVHFAWREKVALCSIVLWISAMLAFISFIFSGLVCRPARKLSWAQFNAPPSAVRPNVLVGLRGRAHEASALRDKLIAAGANASFTLDRQSVNGLFPTTTPTGLFCDLDGFGAESTCANLQLPGQPSLGRQCLYGDDSVGDSLGWITIPWDVIDADPRLFVFNGLVYSLSSELIGTLHPPALAAFINQTLAVRTPAATGSDISMAVLQTEFPVDGSGTDKTFQTSLLPCLHQYYLVGCADTPEPGCIASNLVLIVSVVILIGMVMVKFVSAVFFDWFLSWKLGKISSTFTAADLKSKSDKAATGSQSQGILRSAAMSSGGSLTAAGSGSLSTGTLLSSHAVKSLPSRMICMVTCYSEDDTALRATLDSLAATIYPDDQKLFLIIADGIVCGAGETLSTPDIILQLIQPIQWSPKGASSAHREVFPSLMEMLTSEEETMCAKPASYHAVGHGPARHNQALVVPGTYSPPGSTRAIPVLVVIKVGTAEERAALLKPDRSGFTGKPGNRGKRDSQLILMHFFSRLILAERMNPLDFTMYETLKVLLFPALRQPFPMDGSSTASLPGPKVSQAEWMYLQEASHAHLLDIEYVLFVDADTRVAYDAISRMVTAMERDPGVMGLCGETKILNKRVSWVTRIQVFEYYISHHLSKAFESIFGGVTCLPGCFCMFRLKDMRKQRKLPKSASVSKHAPSQHQQQQQLVYPLLAHPDVVNMYADQDDSSSLHRKNLLLLGEDRYLTTLLLKTFPRRKLIFVPAAICRTTVPETFKVLLSQRRRWINSTLHNLLELVMVSNLCGLFCCSMQFVVLLELLGTVILPASVIFTAYLIVNAVISPPSLTIFLPLAFFICFLFLQAVLVLLTTRKLSYLVWMGWYVLAIPIWNLVLPLYAFWHFDDFSWGQTRKTEGEKTSAQGHGSLAGPGKDSTNGTSQSSLKFDPNSIPMRHLPLHEASHSRSNASLTRQQPPISYP